jgi:hypothetical protein
MLAACAMWKTQRVDPRFVGNAIEIELSVLARRALTSVTRSS